MHTEFMESYGGYLKDKYRDLDKMSKADLCEAKDIACVMKAIFEADKEYHIIEAMEEGSLDNIELTMNELLPRLQRMYEEADSTEKTSIKAAIDKIFT